VTGVAIMALLALLAVSAVLVCVIYMHGRERQEWTAERRALVDRAIAQHAGEVMALDRQARQVPKVKDPPRLVEGLT
jgi:hypothetical protein